jgi:hypothetical protein
MAKNKNLIYIAISLVVFIVLAFLYSTPVFTGKQLFQHDIVQYRGGAKELSTTEPIPEMKPIGATPCSEECRLIRWEASLR